MFLHGLPSITTKAKLVEKIEHCRACGSKSLTPAISNFDRTLKKNKFERKNKKNSTSYALENARIDDFLLCDPSQDSKACGLLQRANSLSTQHHAPLPSATFRVNRDHLRAAATQALEILSGRDCAALDIGCNDGTLLSYYPRWVERFGVDIHDLVEEIGPWAWTAKTSHSSDMLKNALCTKKFEIITCISALEEFEDPQSLINMVKSHLTADGVFVLETLYAPILLTGNNIEHLCAPITSIYSLTVLENLLRNSGLKIFRGSVTGKNSGSIRLFITHNDNHEYDFDPWSERLARLWDEEIVLALQDIAPYQAFSARCEGNRKQFQDILKSAKREKQRIHLIGTDNQSISLCNMAGPHLDAISHIVDYTNQSGISSSISYPLPIIGEAQCRALQPDILIIPSQIKQEMMEIWREAIFAGMRLLIAAPEPHFVDTYNYSTIYGKILSQGDQAGGVETLRSILHAAGRPRLVTVNTKQRTAS